MSPPDERRHGDNRQDQSRQDRSRQEDGNDPAEVWGRRIGRGLGVAALAVLAWLLGRQLHLW
ncbi:hypothetical protein [Methylobacterium nonmethylotrophicum]|uniref:Uncharacterized protein n=1 Tax=Methylobacterium nonmethylotrophicum TaxID=1141884 RepID=A0A4Z0NKW8_9HYPH|nr:hypothetical protein [Methylobacterium nonmethylotrophicum]TGD96401.1 hypothetical protein EU555_23345 [Methylobacterium nonmethylotrophicum]